MKLCNRPTHPVALGRFFFVLGSAICWSIGSLQAQPFFGEQPAPDESQASPTAAPSLFVPVKPGTPPPAIGQQIPTSPVPAMPVSPSAIPSATPMMFVPNDIPAPAVQATGETLDLIPDAGPTPVIGGQPVAKSPSKPAPARRPALTQPTITQDQINKWVAQATDKRSAPMATQVGWAYFNKQEYSSAGVWFNQALEWNASSGEAAYGLALSKFREGDLSSAEAIANFRASSYPKMKTLLGDIYSRRGTEAYESKNYDQSLEFFNKAAANRPLSRNEQIIVAWDLYYTKQYEAAAQRFEQLYRSSPDSVSGQGAYAALSKMKQYDKLDGLAKSGGPIRKMYYTYNAKDYFKSNLFIAAADTGGAKMYPVLTNLTTPSAALGIGYHTKSGSEGEGQLATTRFGLQGQVFPANKFMLSASLSVLNLDAGDLGLGAEVGTVPEVIEYVPYNFKPTSRVDAYDFNLRLEYQDWISWYIEMGMTPIGGPLQARPTGKAGLIWRDTKGYVQGELYSKSNRESMLSWVGMVDPYTGQKWGRVQETGASLSFFRGVGEDNTVFLKAGYGTINGTNVLANTHLYGTAAFAHLFDVPGYEYFSVGLAVSYEQFKNNQNHFTFGNGGYFSPQFLVQGLLQAQFLTKEGGNWLASGSAGVGVQNNRQEASDYFPLDPDGRTFDEQTSSTGIGLIQLQGGYLFDGNWMVGASLNYNVTADYNEGGIMIWGRYFFERRRGLLRSDLLGFDNY